MSLWWRTPLPRVKNVYLYVEPPHQRLVDVSSVCMRFCIHWLSYCRAWDDAAYGQSCQGLFWFPLYSFITVTLTAVHIVLFRQQRRPWVLQAWTSVCFSYSKNLRFTRTLLILRSSVDEQLTLWISCHGCLLFRVTWFAENHGLTYLCENIRCAVSHSMMMNYMVPGIWRLG